MRKTVQLGAAIATIALLSLPATAFATGALHFSAGSGTEAPASTLGPYTMQTFSADSTAEGATVRSVDGPTGALSFDQGVTHKLVPSTWGSWSNGYKSDVYAWLSPPTELTLTMPAGTAAVYFYVEPNDTGPFSFTATAQDGNQADTVTSEPISISGSGGAKYFGFYATGNATVWSVKITSTDNATGGFAVGEFGIAGAPSGPSATTGSASSVTSGSAHLSGAVNPSGAATSYRFEYGASPLYGQSTAAPEASAGSGSSSVAVGADIAGLQPGTTYHYRVVATNVFGRESMGADATFTTAAAAVAAVVVPPAPEAKLSLDGSPGATTSGLSFAVSCSGATCSGKATLTTVELIKGKKVSGISAKAKTKRTTVIVGTASFSVQAGATKTVTVALNATGKRLLGKFKKLPVTLTVTSAGSGGKQVLLTKAHLTISAPKKKR